MSLRFLGLVGLILVGSCKMGVAGLSIVEQVQLCTPGSIFFDVVGNTGPFSVAWNPAIYTGQNLTGLSAGTYEATVTDLSGPYVFSWVVNLSPELLISNTSSWDPFGLGYYYDRALNDSSFISNVSSIFKPVFGATYSGWWANGGGYFVGTDLHPRPTTTEVGVILSDDLTSCSTNHSLEYRFQNLIPDVTTSAGAGFALQFAGRLTTGVYNLDLIECLAFDIFRIHYYSCTSDVYPVTYSMAPPSQYQVVYGFYTPNFTNFQRNSYNFSVPLRVGLPAFSFGNSNLSLTTDGTAPLSYFWSGGPVAFPDRLQPNFLNTEPMNYALTVVDASGTSGKASVLIDAMTFSAAPVVLNLDVYCAGVPLQGALVGGVAPVTIEWELSRLVPGVRLQNDRLLFELQVNWTDGLHVRGLAVDSLGLAQEVWLELPWEWSPQVWGWSSDCTLVWLCSSDGICLIEPAPFNSSLVDSCGQVQVVPVSPCEPSPPPSSLNFSLGYVDVRIVNPVTIQYQSAGLTIEVVTGDLREINLQLEPVQTCFLASLNWTVHKDSSTFKWSSEAQCPNGAQLVFVVEFYNTSLKTENATTPSAEYSYYIHRWPFFDRSHLLALNSSYSKLGSQVNEFPSLNTTLLESIIQEQVKVQVEFQGWSLNDGLLAPVQLRTNIAKQRGTGRSILETQVLFSYFEQEMFYDPLFSLLLVGRERAAWVGLRIIVAFSVAAGIILLVVGLSYTPWGHKIILGEESYRVYQLRDHVSTKSFDDPNEPYVPPPTAPADEAEWI